MRCLVAIWFSVLTVLVTPPLHASRPAGIAVVVEVTHVDTNRWRVDYRFSQPVTSIKFEPVGDYRAQAWKMVTPGLRLRSDADFDVISAGGKPFNSARVDITTFDSLPPKQYAAFNRFSDGGMAMFLGHLQGNAYQGKTSSDMLTDIRVKGLRDENVIAPPLNKATPGGPRGYAYFGPSTAVPRGNALVLIDPQLPVWVRDTLLNSGDKLAQYYEKAYRRALGDKLFIIASVSDLKQPVFSITGGAVLGQLSYRFEGQQILADHPKKREMLTRMVAHEMAHVWQMNLKRGGAGDSDPWIHEGGAEAMALDGLLHTGAASMESVAAYRAAQTAVCDKLGNSVDTYDGIYACGLVRFDKTGVDAVTMWRSLMAMTEEKGEVYSPHMVEAVRAAHGSPAAPAGQ